jgi:hypothetical protein
MPTSGESPVATASLGPIAGRRDFLRAVSLAAGSLTWGCLGLASPSLGGERVTGERTQGAPAVAVDGRRRTAVIQLFLGGGPSHLDMFDLKPHAPIEVRGEFQEIATSVPGLRISEHLPGLAARMHRFSVVRSMTHENSSHLPSSHWLQTGYPANDPVPGHNKNPSTGSIAARLRGANQPGMPAYVAVPRGQAFAYASYLGASFDPFATQAEPLANNFRVPNLALEGDLSPERLGGRSRLLGQLDRLHRELQTRGEMTGVDDFRREALSMITSPQTARAFAIDQESEATRERYGRSPLGQNLLLARRLVESGVTFVSCLSGGGWDTHAHNFRDLKTVLLPRLDKALSALVDDLYERGLDRDVLVNVMGEFGRTPQVNKDAGRDHWPGAGFAFFAGGGLRMGQMIGETDKLAAYPLRDACSPGDVLATVYHVLGIDSRHIFYDAAQRPIPVLPDGRPISSLVG